MEGLLRASAAFIDTSATMKWQVVMWFAAVRIARGMHLIDKTYFEPSVETNCIAYPYVDEKYTSSYQDAIGRMFNEGWRALKPVVGKVINKRSSVVPIQFMHGDPSISERFDIVNNFIPYQTDSLLKEHAKLVQDINSLRQAVFVVPFVEETKDYDDSIFHEIIETTSTTTTSRPGVSSMRYAATSTRYPASSTRGPVLSTRLPVSSTKSSIVSMKPLMTSTKTGTIPIILLGGASQRQIVKSQPITFAKPTISLVGTSVSPLIKHPYPFVMQSTTPRMPPVKICMKALSTMYPMPKQPTLWERLLNFILPSRNTVLPNRNILGR